MPVNSLVDTLKAKGFNLNEFIGDMVSTSWHDEKEKKRFFDHLSTIFHLSRVPDDLIRWRELNSSRLSAIITHADERRKNENR